MPFDASTGWPAPGVTVEHVVFPRGIVETDAAVRHCLSLHVGDPIDVDCMCDGRRHVGVQAPGRLDITPAGAQGRWEDSDDASVILVQIAPSFLQASARSLGVRDDQLNLTPRFQVNDPALAHVIRALAAASEVWPESEPLLIESLAGALGARIVSRYTTEGAAPLRPQQLSLRQRRRVIDYIAANLAERLSLAEVANVAGVSVSHFKVLFRRTMGQPLHKYVVARRIEHAAELIKQGTMPLSEIAAAAGFAHQSHMARSMRRSLGVTPSTLAREHRSV